MLVTAYCLLKCSSLLELLMLFSQKDATFDFYCWASQLYLPNASVAIQQPSSEEHC